MARQIRLSKADAIAAGLLDPSVADLVRSSSKRVKSTKLPAKSASSPDPSQKKKRSVSRPAVHPKMSAGPAGSGSFKVDSEDKVCSAEFLFDLVPVPKERPRVVKDPETQKTFGYTPARTKYFTVEVKRVVEAVFKSKKPIEGPVRLEMAFVMQVPKSWPKWKREAALEGMIVPTGRPDMDNLEKALLDAFNETLIVDDAYVIDRRATKIYGEMPQIMTSVVQTGQFDVNVRREAVEARRRLLSSSKV